MEVFHGSGQIRIHGCGGDAEGHLAAGEDENTVIHNLVGKYIAEIKQAPISYKMRLPGQL